MRESTRELAEDPDPAIRLAPLGRRWPARPSETEPLTFAMSLAVLSRTLLIDFVCRVVAGQGLKSDERRRVEERLRLLGFR